MDRGATVSWWATVRGVAESQTRLSTHTKNHAFATVFLSRLVDMRKCSSKVLAAA